MIRYPIALLLFQTDPMWRFLFVHISIAANILLCFLIVPHFFCFWCQGKTEIHDYGLSLIFYSETCVRDTPLRLTLNSGSCGKKLSVV